MQQKFRLTEYGKSLKPEDGLGAILLETIWDFKAAREEEENLKGSQALFDLATCFSHVMEAANSLGWQEHTCDWDPYLSLDLTDGSNFEMESHYYQVKEVTDTHMYIEAPGEEVFDEEPIPHRWSNTHKWGPCYEFLLKEIDCITIDSQ